MQAYIEAIDLSIRPLFLTLTETLPNRCFHYRPTHPVTLYLNTTVGWYTIVYSIVTQYNQNYVTVSQASCCLTILCHNKDDQRRPLVYPVLGLALSECTQWRVVTVQVTRGQRSPSPQFDHDANFTHHTMHVLDASGAIHL